MRAREVAAWASSSRLKTNERSTTDCALIDVGTTEDDPSSDVAGSAESD